MIYRVCDRGFAKTNKFTRVLEITTEIGGRAGRAGGSGGDAFGSINYLFFAERRIGRTVASTLGIAERVDGNILDIGIDVDVLIL